MSLKIEQGVGATQANVTNQNLAVTLPQTPAQAGYAILAGEQSNAADQAGAVFEKIRASAQGRLTVGQPVQLLNEVFSTAALNTAIFQSPVTTMTITVGAGTLNLNAGAITTINTNAMVRTWAFYPLQADFATYSTFDMSYSVAPQVNDSLELGFFQATGTAAVTDGAYFQWDTTATLKAVLNNNGTPQFVTITAMPSAAVMHKYKIVCENDRVLYYIDGACVAIITPGVGLGMPMFAQAQPWAVRKIHGGVLPALASVVKVGYLFIGLQDAAGLGKDNATVQTMGGRMGSQGQSGHAMGSTALLTNSMATGAGAAMTNTTAALGSGLGGQFTALPTLAAGTDGILDSFQNPAVTANIPGKTLWIKGVKIQGCVTTVLAGNATPVIYLFSLAYSHNAATLATAEGVSSKAPRRVPLGFEVYAAAAAVGTLGSVSGVYFPFTAPIPINPSEFVQVVAKNVGAVTTTGAITWTVGYDSYWE